MLFAATHPKQTRALVLCGCFACFATSFVPTEEQFYDYVEHAWGTGGSLPFFAPTRANDPIFESWWGRFERLGASPAAAKSLIRMNMQLDVSDILSTDQVPTLVIHRTDDALIKVKAGRYLAENIPNARYIELPGKSGSPSSEATLTRLPMRLRNS